MKDLINNVFISMVIFSLLFLLVACLYAPLYLAVITITGTSFNNITFLLLAITYGVSKLWEIVKP